jgi:spermidine synthase
MRKLLVCVLCCWSAAACADDYTLLHQERSLYREVFVYQDQDERCMCFTNRCRVGRQSCRALKEPQHIVMTYPRLMLGALYVDPAPKRVLIIGLGGGTLPDTLLTLLPQSQIDVVEIDPAVTRVARRYFDLPTNPRLHIAEEDGRVFVKRALREKQEYDLVMLDAFDHEYIPEHLLTREFLTEVKSILTPEGVLAANTFSSSRLYDHESTTYASVFGRFYNLKQANRVIIAQRSGLPTMQTIETNAKRWGSAFHNLGFSSSWLTNQFSTRQDWDAQARVLTDQYSPANLLNR